MLIVALYLIAKYKSVFGLKQFDTEKLLYLNGFKMSEVIEDGRRQN